MTAKVGYCLARCYCGDCPQYAEQRRQLAALRTAEYLGRLAREARERAERQHGARGRRTTGGAL